MLLILSTLLPVFALLFIGIMVERLRLVPVGGAATLNQLVFNLSMPCLIFNSMALSKPAELAQTGYVIGTLAGALLCFIVAHAMISRGFRRQNREASIMGLLSAFPNAAFLGLPIVISLFPHDHDALIASTITAVLGLPFILAAMFVQEWCRNAGDVSRTSLLIKVTRSMLCNPILIATVLGAFVCVAGIPLPDSVLLISRNLAATAVPCALVALGMVLSLQMTNTAAGKNHILWQVIAHVLKLLIMPASTWAFMAAMEVPGKWIAMGVILATMPAGSMAYVLSETYDVCPRDSSSVILVSTALSVLTIPLTVWLLQGAGLFPR